MPLTEAERARRYRTRQRQRQAQLEVVPPPGPLAQAFGETVAQLSAPDPTRVALGRHLARYLDVREGAQPGAAGELRRLVDVLLGAQAEADQRRVRVPTALDRLREAAASHPSRRAASGLP